MLNNLKLASKINIILALTFIVIVMICGTFLSTILKNRIEQEVSQQALLLIETMNSVRTYTSTQVNPELAPRLETEEDFIPETVPAYSARIVFENLKKKNKYSDFVYKEATLNPTNPKDKANAFETQIIQKFKNSSYLQELTGFHDFSGQNYFYIARPLAVNEESCLRCHSDPKLAPKSQIKTYGSENGFGWSLNEIVASQIVLVPASQVIKEAKNLQISVIGLISGFFLIGIIAFNLFIRTSIIKPLVRMAKLSQQISTGNMEGEFKHNSQDEIGILAISLNRMKISLQMALDMLNKNNN